ncbi:MAG TPA: tetratricopeptide repeat protein [Devosia sp.]|nr:tetratricopeptide repeat protein [Devosia sp.]
MRKIIAVAGTLVLALTLSLPSLPTLAVDTGGNGGSNDSSSVNVPSMSEARADINAARWKSAIAKLKLIIADNGSNADAYNLLGYAYRNLEDYKRAGQYYARALKLDPNHTGALEYQGILFVKLGELDNAKANLAKLGTICGTSCEEYEDLAKAISG